MRNEVKRRKESVKERAKWREGKKGENEMGKQ